MQHEDTPIHPVCPPGGESCRSEAPERSPSSGSSGSPMPMRSEGEFRDRIMRVAARRAEGIRSRSISSNEVDGARPVRPDDRPINRVVLLRSEARPRERSPSRTSSKSPRPIRANGELDERNSKVAARRAAGIQSRSVSPNEVAMRPNSSGHVDGSLSTTARIVKTMCRKAVGRHSKDGGGTPQALSPDPMSHAMTLRWTQSLVPSAYVVAVRRQRGRLRGHRAKVQGQSGYETNWTKITGEWRPNGCGNSSRLISASEVNGEMPVRPHDKPIYPIGVPANRGRPRTPRGGTRLRLAGAATQTGLPEERERASEWHRGTYTGCFRGPSSSRSPKRASASTAGSSITTSPAPIR